MAENKIPSPFPPPLPSGPEYGNPEDARQAVPDDKPAAPAKKKQEQPKKRTANATYATSYFNSGQFDKDVKIYQGCASRTTGYAELDKQQPFYPGLYCLGAISSLGKTTFAHQMADQIAIAGGNVLYFSLEQSHFELYSKSLARGFAITRNADAAKNNGISQYPTPSSIDIRRGLTTSYPDKMAAQIDAYTRAVGDRLCVIDGAFSLTVEDIRTLTAAYVKQTGTAPVVIVDYLQIIAPSTINGRIPDTKTSIDHIVHSMKVMQRDLDLSVLLISSLNRQNYMTPVDFESFKESGGIEYTADVVWGLQLTILNDELFSKENRIKEKREKIREEKARPRRKIDLVCLKNRYGISSYTLPFTYIPACDYFISEKPDPSNC
mgnify:CR=1 FL=1|jgi:replicative DNA helicase